MFIAMMLEWDMFVKPIMYVLELVFGAVVTFGTADKLLRLVNGHVKCELDNSLGACLSVILIGSLALLMGLVTLWWRLVAAFDDDVQFSCTDEAQLCTLCSTLWLVVASVVTAKMRFNGTLRGEKIVTITFSWLLVAFCALSAAAAWLVPERDDVAQTVTAPRRSNSEMSLELDNEDMPTPANEKRNSELTRVNATRWSQNTPDVVAINDRLTSWELEIDGPPARDAHADALGAAKRMPLSAQLHLSTSAKRFFGSSAMSGTVGISSGVISPGSRGGVDGSQSIRRRVATLSRIDDDEDEISPAK